MRLIYTKLRFSLDEGQSIGYTYLNIGSQANKRQFEEILMPQVKKINLKFWAVVMATLLCCPVFLYALPSGENVVEGNVTFDRSESNTLKVNVASERAIIDYNNFSIAANESVYFSQPSVSATALNRVTGNNSSAIFGNLNANGIIYLINPNGINIGPNANINAASFIASTLNISNADFLAGRNNFFKDGANAFILNQGNIIVRNGGYVALLSQAIENKGTILANLGTVVMASGEKMTLALDDLNQISVVIDEGVKEAVFGPDGKRIDSAVKNSGTITANGGKVLLTAKVLNKVFDCAVNNTGVVEAKSLVNKNGVIELKGEGAAIVNSGTLNAGTVKVDAVNTEFINKGKIISEAQENIVNSGTITIQVNSLLQGGSIIADKLISVTADKIDVFIKDNPLAVEVDPLLNTSPAVIIQAPEVKVIARQFGSSDAPLNINAPLTYIYRTSGDINILDSLGIGTSILLRGPPDGFGAIVYNKDFSLTLEAQDGSISEAQGVTISASNLTLTANQNINIQGTLKSNSVILQSINGNIILDAGSLIDASGDVGGLIEILGKQVELFGAQINASGLSGGGTVLIGGDFQGKGTVVNATNVYVSRDSYINADAISQGDGGKVIVWSDGATQYYGHISARGGSESGNGGFVQVSSAQSLDFNGFVNALAPNGARGTFILDPTGNSGYAASLATDLLDYKPGETVIIMGSGWQPGETVSLILHPSKDTLSDTTLTAVADANGNFSNSTFTPQEDDRGVLFALTATGQSSGLAAKTTFTDATITTAGSGNWNSTTANAPWPGGTVPSSTDNVIIAAGHTVTVTAAASITNLTLNATTSKLVINSGQTITVSGTFSNSGTTTNGVNGPGTILFTGTASFGSLTPTGTRPNVTVGNGTSTNTVTIGANTLVADLTVSVNATLTNTTRTVGVSGNLSNSGTLTAGSGVYTLSGATKTISGTLTIPSVAVTGTYTNNGTLTVSTALTGAGGLTNGATGTLNIGGTSTITTLTATAVGNTVNYNANGNQTACKVTTYHNLTLSVAGIKTFLTSPTVNGILSLEGTATVVATTGTVTYGAGATLQYNTATARTASSEEWITPFAATGGVIIANTGVITLNAAKVVNAPLTIYSGATLATTGSFTLTLGGNVTLLLDGAGAIGATISGNLALGSTTRTFTIADGSATNDLSISAVISGTGGLTKAGTGTLTLSGTAANTYSGVTTVVAGELDLNKTAALNAFAGSLTIGDGTGGANADIVKLLAADQIPAVTITISTSGKLDLNDLSDAVGALTMTGGNVTTGAGTLSLGGTVTGNASDTSATISGNLGLGAARTFTIANGAAANDMVISAVISGAFAITKDGAGVLVLSGANTYSGASTVSAGTLTFSGDNGAATSSTSFTVSYGAMLTLDNSSANNINRIGAVGITLNGGNFNFIGTNVESTNASETVGTLTIGAGFNTVTITPGTGGSTTMTFGSLSRTAGATALFRGTSFGSAPAANVSTLMFTTAPTLLGGGGAAGSTTVSIIRGAFGDSSLEGVGTDMVTYNVGNTNGLRLLNGAGFTNEYRVDSFASGANVKLTQAVTASTMTINSLILESGSSIADAGVARTITLGSSTRTGNIISFSGNDGISGANTTIALGSIEGCIFTRGDLTISSLITGTGGLTKTGSATLTYNVANAYTGITYVNAGTLFYGINDAISSGGVTIFNATLDLNNHNDTIGALIMTGGSITTGTGTLTLGGNVTGNANITSATISGKLDLGNNNRTFTIANGTASDDMIISAVISSALGDYGITKATASSVLVLSGANTYTGATTINAGTISVSLLDDGGEASGIGASSSDASNLIINNTGTFLYTGPEASTDRLFSIGAGTTGCTIDSSGTGAITFTNTGAIAFTGSSARTLTLTGTNNINMAFILGDGAGGATALTKSGTGTLTITSANTYTGTTTISAGTLIIQNNTALGTTAGVTAITSGATLGIDGSGLSIGETITNLLGTGVGAAGALKNISGNNTWTGVINSSTGGGTIGSDAGTLLITGGIVSSNDQLTITGAGNVTFTTAAIAIGTAALTKNGAGTLTLGFTNTYTGATTINAGVLNIQNALATGTTTGGVTVASGAALQIQGGIDVGAEALTLNGTGISNDGALRNISGTNSWAGAITLGSATRINSDAETLTISGGITGTGLALTVGGSGNTKISTTGINTSTAGTLTKDGSGTLTITAAGNYTGLTTVNAGVLNIQNALATGTTTGGVTVASGAALQIQGGIDVGAEALTLNGTGISNDGALRNISGTNSWAGAITLGSSTTIASDANTLTLSGTVNCGDSDLTLSGAGNIVFNGTVSGLNNLTFSGAGTKTTPATLTIAGNWDVSSPAALNTNNTIVNLTDNLTGSGDITQGSGLITIGGDWTNTGTFSASSAGVTLTGASKQITGNAGGITFSTLTVDGTYTNKNTSGLTVSTALSGAGTLTQGTNAVLNIGGTSGIATLTATANPNTVNYNGAAQTVKAVTYYNLTLSGSGTKTLPAAFTATSFTATTASTTIIFKAGANYAITNLTIDGQAAGTRITLASDIDDTRFNLTNLSGTVSVANVDVKDSNASSLITPTGSNKDSGNNINWYFVGHFTISGTASQTAGTSNQLTITAVDGSGGTSTSFTGDKVLVFSGANSIGSFTPTVTDKTGSAINFGSNTTITFTNGVSTSGGSMVLYKAESASISATQGSVNTPTPLSVDVTPASASKLLFGQQPSNVAFGTVISPAVTVHVADQFSNTVTSDNSTNITIAIGIDASSGIAILSGTLIKTASGGIATFNNLSISFPGNGYTLSVASTGLTSAASNTFNITGNILSPATSAFVNSQVSTSDILRILLPNTTQLNLYQVNTFIPTGPVYLYHPLTPSNISAFEGIEGRRGVPQAK